jgi:hypothetical protein
MIPLTGAPPGRRSDEPLHPHLLPYLREAPVFGLLLKHPLVVMPLPASSLNAAANRMYAQKCANLMRAEQAGDWSSVVFLHERPFRLDALLHYRERMPEATFWGEVASVYTDTENAHEDHKTWIGLFADALHHREHLMNVTEHAAWAALPEKIVMYRGTGVRENERNLGLSWTTARERAVWFARRFREHGYLVTGTARRDDVVACFSRRGEEEIIVLPRSVALTDIRALSRKGAQPKRSSP